MNIILTTPRKSLNKAYLKVKPSRSEIELFKINLIKLLDGLDESESEEHVKNDLSDFLKNTFYQKFYINTKGRNDLVIHNGPDAKSVAGVLIEAKKPSNKSEMIRPDNLNAKAFQELILYYLRERITNRNLEIKHLVATNIYEWYVFDSGLFEKLFAQNKTLVKQFTDFEEGRLSGNTTDFFYKQIAEPFLAELTTEICFTMFDFREYDKPLRNDDKKDDSKLIALYKLLSPEHLLKLPFANDSNSLDKTFYSELLHIIGLTETKEGSKKLIGRKKEGQRDSGSLLENAIIQIDSLDMISRLVKPSRFGETNSERLFNVSLELVITWINRILFLKLLEAQLIRYHKGDSLYTFLDIEKVKGFDSLNSLFFRVLAKKSTERDPAVAKLFEKVPYLNSSLFEPTELERETIFMSNLQDDCLIPIHSGTVLKSSTGKRLSGPLNGLDYLFAFLDAYDFSGEGAEEIQEENKTLINSSVLGLIFEKINGYKDGSFFTPGFITMYMCRETIRRAVVQKFNDLKDWNCQNLEELYDKIEDKKEANDIINSLKICDPGVGSGHFLVSALNEIIAIKSELKILSDKQEKRLKEYHVEVANDELIVTDEDGELFEYNPKSTESQRVQEAIFHEKQTIIENCLFGVDINPNSVKICRLRLWIELLKNSYYKAESNYTELETLPNIDINIKCGNSLISRYALDADIKQALKKSKWSIESYRLAVKMYRNATSKEQKREMERLIASIKTDFETEVAANDKRLLQLKKLNGDLFNLTQQTSLFERTRKELADWNKQVNELTGKIKKLEAALDEIKNNKIYENAFEWRLEFPEVLNDEGDFVGFDVVIGNPPYFSLSKEHSLKTISSLYRTYNSTGDIYCLFYELANNILKKASFTCFITSNKWMRANYGMELRNYFIEFLNPLLLVDFSWYQVFESASVDTNIFLFQRMNNMNMLQGVLAENDFQIEFISEYIAKKSRKLSFSANDYWNISNSDKQKIKCLFVENGKELEKWDISIFRGVLTGLNEAFIIDESTKNRLIEADPKNSKIIKHLIRGRDVERYCYNFQNLYLINSHNGVKSLGIEMIHLEKDYPMIFEYLKQFEIKAILRDDQGDHWSNLRNCAYLKEFENEKLVWAETMRVHKNGDRNFPRFGYDVSGIYTDKTVFFGVGKHIKYLLAFLNSKVGRWLIQEYVTKLDTGGYMMQKIFLDKIPIFEPTIEQEDNIVAKVIQILSIKNSHPTADTNILEKEIDQLVYELYGFTDEEIKTIEGSL